MTYRGYIFDLDGVLTDTAHFHYLAWLHLAQDLGLQFTERTTSCSRASRASARLRSCWS